MLKNLKSTEYADALRDALVERRNGTIDMITDNLLGQTLWSITQWSIADMVREGKLWRTFSQDPDFQSEVLSYVVSYIDKVDLTKSPKQVLKYLYTAGRSKCIRVVKYANRVKRKHEDVALDDVVLRVDFWGASEKFEQ